MRLLYFSILLFALQSFAMPTNAQEDSAVDSFMKSYFKELLAESSDKPSIDELFENSDLVVIAKCAAHSDKLDWNTKLASDLGFAPDSVNCIRNTLTVIRSLKGEAAGEVDVLSLFVPQNVKGLTTEQEIGRFDKLRVSGEMPPQLQDFNAHRMFAGSHGRWWVEPVYLVFLKQTRDDDLFVPVTGPRFSSRSLMVLDKSY